MSKRNNWEMNGELILNCCCTVFCPCVVSLGQHAPTEGYCQGWAGIRIDDGYYGNAKLDGLNIGLLLDIPGNMGRGNWKAALYIDERADGAASSGLEKIFTGQAGGSTGLLKILVGEFLGTQQVPISYATNGDTRIFNVAKKIEGAITPVTGGNGTDPVVIKNSGYWISHDVVVAQADKSRVRDFGRVWDFDGRSSEICQIAWRG